MLTLGKAVIQKESSKADSSGSKNWTSENWEMEFNEQDKFDSQGVLTIFQRSAFDAQFSFFGHKIFTVKVSNFDMQNLFT